MGTATYQIVPARAEDLPAISALAGEIWHACYPGVISHEQIAYMLAWMYDVETMRGELAAGVVYERLLVDGVLAGFAAWGPGAEPGVCKLHKLYLLPAHQGRGLGSGLLAHVCAAAKGRGFGEIVLNVNKRNTRAIATYTRNGFSVRASVCDAIGGGYVMDDYVMGKAL